MWAILLGGAENADPCDETNPELKDLLETGRKIFQGHQ
jgi:hypothetical protein